MRIAIIEYTSCSNNKFIMKKIFASLLLVLVCSCYGIDERAQRRLIRDIKKGDLSDLELEKYIQVNGLEACWNPEVVMSSFRYGAMVSLLIDAAKKHGVFEENYDNYMSNWCKAYTADKQNNRWYSLQELLTVEQEFFKSVPEFEQHLQSYFPQTSRFRFTEDTKVLLTMDETNQKFWFLKVENFSEESDQSEEYNSCQGLIEGLLALNYPKIDKELYPAIIEAVLNKTASSSTGYYSTDDLITSTRQLVKDIWL